MDDKGWHPGHQSGFQLFSKLLPQEKTLPDSVVTTGTQKNITNNCCKKEGASLGLIMSLVTGEPLQASTAAMGWGGGSKKLQAKSTASTLQSLDKE